MDYEKIADGIYKSVESRIEKATAPLLLKIAELEKQLASTEDLNARLKAVEDREPTAGVDGLPGSPGERGDKGEPGAIGVGLAGAMIDRDGGLVVTLSNGEVKSLGQVVGKDGKDGVDGVGLDTFEMEYLPEEHEISVKASCQGRVKELRYPAGGIRPAGYWREGTKAKSGEAWVQDGSLWIAIKDTGTKPATNDEGWIIAARKGRDGERGQKGADSTPIQPIKLVN